jgi:uncharacterized membrane protein YcaP (DUF421 family)
MQENSLFFSGWSNLGRTALIGLLAYVALIFLLRISGRRTLSKMNAFDLTVTVALGSTLATTLLNNSVTLAQGSVAFAVLIGVQYVVTWASVRTGWVRNLVTGEPALLLFEGQFLPTAMRKARVTEQEVRAAVRGAGKASLEDVAAVIIETDGSFSVVGGPLRDGHSSFEGVKRPGKPSDPDHPPRE